MSVALLAGLMVLGLLAGEGWLLLNLLQQNGRLLVRLEAVEAHLDRGNTGPAMGLAVGSPAPSFELSGLDGKLHTLDKLRAPGNPVLLFFVDPDCGPCNALLREIGRWQQEHATTLALALLSSGTPESSRAMVARHEATPVLLQHDREVAEAYRADGTPSAVLVRPDGTIGSPLALGAEAIRALVARTLAEPALTAPIPLPPAGDGGSPNGAARMPAVPPAPQIGDPAPAHPAATASDVSALSAQTGHAGVPMGTIGDVR